MTPDLDGLLTTSVVIPPDSEIVAKFSVSGIRPHGCTLVEPARCLIEEYGVVVGHTLVDASSGFGSVLIVNPNVEVVVLPGLTLIGKLVPVVAISVAIEDTGPPNNGPVALPEYLEEIVKGSHPSLGDAGRQLLRDLLFRYRHVFPAPGEPVTGRTTKVQHDIISAVRTVQCSGDVREADGSCFVWDALVPMLGLFRRRDLVWRNCHVGSWAPGRGTVPSEQLLLTAQGQEMYLHTDGSRFLGTYCGPHRLGM